MKTMMMVGLMVMMTMSGFGQTNKPGPTPVPVILNTNAMHRFWEFGHGPLDTNAPAPAAKTVVFGTVDSSGAAKVTATVTKAVVAPALRYFQYTFNNRLESAGVSNVYRAFAVRWGLTMSGPWTVLSNYPAGTSNVNATISTPKPQLFLSVK